jgi:hypothetical protein
MSGRNAADNASDPASGSVIARLAAFLGKPIGWLKDSRRWFSWSERLYEPGGMLLKRKLPSAAETAVSVPVWDLSSTSAPETGAPAAECTVPARY